MLAVWLPVLSSAQDSALVIGRTADMWLVDPETGQITGYDTGMWMQGVRPEDYPLIDLSATDALLINTLPNSSVRMSPGQPVISLIGIGEAALLVNQGGEGGHRDLIITPESGAFADTIAVQIGVSTSLLEDGLHRLTYSAVETGSGTTVVNSGAQLVKGSGGTGENAYYTATLYLATTGEYVVTARLQGATVDTTEVRNYSLNIPVGKERRDTDGDGIPDVVEVDMGLNPFEDDWMADKDGNGWSEFDEWLRRFCLDPGTLQPLDAGPDCLDTNGVPLDSDNDNWTDFDEILRGTNHNDPEPLITPQVAAPPASQKIGFPGLLLQAPTTINEAKFCAVGTSFLFDLRFHAEADDASSFDIIVGVGADNSPFVLPNESIRVNFGETGQITRQAPAVRWSPSTTEDPIDRWLDGPIDDFTIESVGDSEWHVFGSVTVGTEAFVPGDTVANFSVRAMVSGESSFVNVPISGDLADCSAIPSPEREFSEYEAQQRLRFKDYPAANRLYEVENLVQPGGGVLSVPPLANILLDQQAAGASNDVYTGIVVQSFTPTQDNIAGIDVRVAANADGVDGVEDIYFNIWADALRVGEPLLSQKIDDVDINGDPDRPIIVRFEPVAVQPGNPIYFEFRQKQAALVATSAGPLGGAGVLEGNGDPQPGTADLVFDVYYDANFNNGIGGTRAGFQWWTVAAASVDGALAYDATKLLRDSDITAAGLLPTDIADRRRMTPLANALGSSRLPEMRLPAGTSQVVSAVHRHHVPDSDGWRAPADYSRIYKRWLPRTDDVTPQAMLAEMGEGTWTTAAEW
ncbi:MAG: hypothetical protein OEM25_03445, partial [Gammaproteobacteria bacterium]|nr:hypothetical protein [Gammaproteobacteria bacterium]